MPRIAAANALVAVEARDAYSNLALNAQIKRRKLKRLDARLATELTYGVLKNRVFIDRVLSARLKRPLMRLEPKTRALLRLGVYQLIYMTRMPGHAAIGETVESVKRFAPWRSGLLNALLRRVQREAEDIVGSLQEIPNDAAGLGTKFGLPETVAADLIARFGLKDAIAYAEFIQIAPPVTLRVRDNAQRSTIVQELAEKAGEVTATPYSPSGVRVVAGGRPDKLPPVANGDAVVQDEGSQLVSLFAGPEPGMRVLDLCAGRGGKSFHLADLMDGEGMVAAHDVHQGKLRRLQNDAVHLGLKIIQVEPPLTRPGTPESGDHPAVGYEDADFDPRTLEPAALVLVDAPCSGAGSMRRHPELRWKLSSSRLAALAEGQRRLLDVAATLVLPNGLLVYAVCSDLASEGIERVDAFLAQNSNFERSPAPDAVDVDWTPLLNDVGDLSLFPHVHGTDGFFAARLRKLTGPPD